MGNHAAGVVPESVERTVEHGERVRVSGPMPGAVVTPGRAARRAFAQGREDDLSAVG